MSTINDVYVTHLTEVDSSVIEKVGYNSKSGILYVQFHNGTISSYGATVYTYSSLVNAHSVGAYYNSYIKNSLSGKGSLYWTRLVLDRPAAAAAKASTDAYTVTVTVSGTMTLEVDANNFAEAVAKANTTLAASFKDTSVYEITSVNKA